MAERILLWSLSAQRNYKKAAELGHVEATLELAKAQRSGSLEKEIELYESVAVRSDVAKRELAKIYRDHRDYADTQRAIDLFLAIETLSAKISSNNLLKRGERGNILNLCYHTP